MSRSSVTMEHRVTVVNGTERCVGETELRIEKTWRGVNNHCRALLRMRIIYRLQIGIYCILYNSEL